MQVFDKGVEVKDVQLIKEHGIKDYDKKDHTAQIVKFQPDGIEGLIVRNTDEAMQAIATPTTDVVAPKTRVRRSALFSNQTLPVNQTTPTSAPTTPATIPSGNILHLFIIHSFSFISYLELSFFTYIYWLMVSVPMF